MTPTLVLIPGLLCDGWVWRHQVDAFKAQFPVYVPVLYEPPTMTAMAQYVLDHTSGPLAVAGHSMGGRAAFEMARLAPERVVKLAGLDTGYDLPKPTERKTRMHLVDIARRQGMRAVADHWLPPMVHPDRVHDSALMDPLVAMIERANPEIFARQQNALLTRGDALHLSHLRCPTLFLCGRQDLWSPVLQHEEMQAMMPGSKLTVLENCGHMAPVEQPEAVTQALEQWLLGDRLN